jgi:hypothetical protein
MTAEVSLFGVYIPVALLAAGFAGLINMGLSRMLRETRAHGWVWHVPLFEACMFVILWAAFDMGLGAIPNGVLSLP